MKQCTGCRVVKSLREYYADNRTRDGKCTRCKICHEARYSTWKRANKQKVLGYNQTWYASSGVRFLRHGITQEQYDRILTKQKGLCAICELPEPTIIRGKQRPLQIDHDHETGRVRGLLCSACNTGIGKFSDSADRLDAAARYLRQRPIRIK